MTSYAATINIPYHIEEDLFIPGNLLFSTYRTLESLDSSRLANVLVGSPQGGYAEGIGAAAMFNNIHSFVQLSASHILVVDYNNHCVRSVNRLTNQTSHYIGSCGSRGNEDGANPKFSNPYGIIRDIMDSKQSLIITDCFNHAIKRITQTPLAAETIIQSNELINYPRGLTQQPTSGDIYVMITDGIVRYDYSLGTVALAYFGTWVSLPGGSSYNNPRHGRQMDLQRGAHLFCEELKLIDLDNNTSMTICNGENATADGNLTECEIDNPYGLAVLGDKLYIGSRNWIRVIQGTTAPKTTTTSITSTPTTTTTATPLTATTATLTTGILKSNPTPSISTANKKAAEPITDVQLAIITGGIVAVLLIAALSAVCIYRIRHKSRNTNEQEVQIEVQDYLPPINRHQLGIPLELDHVYSEPDENGIYVLNPYHGYGLDRPTHHAQQVIENVAAYDEIHDDGYERAISSSVEGRMYTTLDS